MIDQLTFALSPVDRKPEVSLGASVAMVALGVVVARLVAGLAVLAALAVAVAHAI